MNVKRGDICLINLEPVKGSEQGGVRPGVVLQNNVYNKYSPVIIIAVITSKIFTKQYPTNVFLTKNDSGLDRNSNVLLNQIRTIDKNRIIKKIASLNKYLMEQIDIAVKISLDLD